MYKSVASTALVVVVHCCWHIMRAAPVDCCIDGEPRPDELITCFVLGNAKDCLMLLVFKLIQFYIKCKKMVN